MIQSDILKKSMSIKSHKMKNLQRMLWPSSVLPTTYHTYDVNMGQGKYDVAFVHVGGDLEHGNADVFNFIRGWISLLEKYGYSAPRLVPRRHTNSLSQRTHHAQRRFRLLSQ